MIMMATLMMVATIERRMINPENERFPPADLEGLNAIRFAIKPATPKLIYLSLVAQSKFFSQSCKY
jgi:hypothetical protein